MLRKEERFFALSFIFLLYIIKMFLNINLKALNSTFMHKLNIRFKNIYI